MESMSQFWQREIVLRVVNKKTKRFFCIAIHIITYVFAPWSAVLLEKLSGSHVVKKFRAFYGTGRFNTAFTCAHLTCPYTEPARSSPCPHLPHPEDPC